MKRQSLKIIVLMFLIGLTAIGSVCAIDLGTRGYTTLRTGSDNGYTVYTLRHSSGNQVTVNIRGTVSSNQADMLDYISETFFNLVYMNISSLKVVFSENKADILVIPSSFSYDGVSLVRYMPSGMQFSYTGTLEYDFRLFVEKLFLRMRGQFFNAEQFAEKLVTAVNDPYLYIQSQDPEYIIRRFDNIDDDIGALKEEDRQIDLRLGRLTIEQDGTERDVITKDTESKMRDRKIESNIADLEGELTAADAAVMADMQKNDDMLRAEAESAHESLERKGRAAYDDLEERGIEAYQDLYSIGSNAYSDLLNLGEAAYDDLLSKGTAAYNSLYSAGQKAYNDLLEQSSSDIAERKAAHDELQAAHDELKASHEELTANYQQLLAEFETLRYAVLVFNNKGMFGSIKLPAQDTIDKIIELRRSNQDITVKDAVTALKAQGVVVTKNEVHIVFGAYFNQFE
jgi:hypothetical protein